ncbi:MAG TPA: DoxX family protein [Ferruginibacter sp.]|nr:DoxX family protein [Ferruginibacter sp.]HMP20015.1 DoxX family protein [Ferruginibacter sp.]
MKKLFSAAPIAPEAIIALLRLVIAVFLIIHGKEVFDAAKMEEYTKWDSFKTSAVMPYLGKGAEFVAGVLLFVGLFTRLASIITIGTFAYITFLIGNGRFWMDDQHPFMFILFGLLFFFAGPGIMSMDALLFRTKKPY